MRYSKEISIFGYRMVRGETNQGAGYFNLTAGKLRKSTYAILLWRPFPWPS